MFQTTNQYTTISLYSHRRPVPVSPVRQGRQDFLLCRVQHRTLHVYLSGRWSQNTTIVDWIYWKNIGKNIGKTLENIGKTLENMSHVGFLSNLSIYLSVCLSVCLSISWSILIFHSYDGDLMYVLWDIHLYWTAIIHQYHYCDIIMHVFHYFPILWWNIKYFDISLHMLFHVAGYGV